MRCSRRDQPIVLCLQRRFSGPQQQPRPATCRHRRSTERRASGSRRQCPRGRRATQRSGWLRIAFSARMKLGVSHRTAAGTSWGTRTDLNEAPIIQSNSSTELCARDGSVRGAELDWARPFYVLVARPLRKKAR